MSRNQAAVPRGRERTGHPRPRGGPSGWSPLCCVGSSRVGGTLDFGTERGQRLGTRRTPANVVGPLTGPHELRPSDILIERFQAWKRLVKNLIAYFEGIADIEVSFLVVLCGSGDEADPLCPSPTRQRNSPSSAASSKSRSRRASSSWARVESRTSSTALYVLSPDPLVPYGS